MKELLICDIPDEYQSLRAWFKEIKNDYPATSFELLLSAIRELERGGFIRALCVPIGGGCWRLPVMLGFGRTANLVFTELRNGNYLAVHGFTSSNDAELEQGCAIGISRKEAVE